MTLNQAINNKDFDQEFEVIIINDDKPITFTKNDYKVEEGDPIYTNADEYEKSGSGIARLTQNTLAIYTSDDIEYEYPKNWSKVIENAGIYNRSHIIGYSLSARKSDRNNIFIGTEYLNQITMKKVEKEIYDDIKNNNREYLYKVTPYYHKTDVVPFGVLIEAETTDKLKQNTVCRFCYNIQDGHKINYYDGGFKPIEKVFGTREEKVIKRRNTDKSNNKYREYAINIRTKMFHLNENEEQKCSALKNVPLKYIQETKADKNEVINKKCKNKNGIEKQCFQLCKRCIKN